VKRVKGLLYGQTLSYSGSFLSACLLQEGGSWSMKGVSMKGVSYARETKTFAGKAC